MTEFVQALSQLTWPGAIALAALAIAGAWVLVTVFKVP
jgi:hypothetical protein